ncbi:MarR family winged helix-turn-helix transcriptional regulator [Glutamicibacter sp. NPDC087344]|uniref:MarR family winged helix-turn-helix transcriptional regulator n=1 Tax=Glutamicibacter sp. NPDC087344 TaxID=3363994 RepID=UPI003825C2FD
MSTTPSSTVEAASSIATISGTLSRLLGHAAGQGRSVTAWRVLSVLDRDGAQRVGDLAIAQRVAQPTMTGLVIRLEHDQLVSRRADPNDRRASLVELTDSGKAEVDAYRLRAISALTSGIQALPETEQQILASAAPLLQKVCDELATQLDK